MTQTSLTLVDLLRTKAQQQPHQVVYRFLKDGERENGYLSYQLLDEKARAIAVYLQKLNLSGSRIVLVYPYDKALTFIAAFFGCLYAGSIAVPCHPPLGRNNFLDLETRLISCQADAIITDETLIHKLQKQLKPKHWIVTDHIPSTEGQEWSSPPIQPDSLAFLQYTSGSTGIPKGVMITHQSILQNQRMLQMSFQNTETSIGVGWLPLFHDMGLIGHVIQTLYVGGVFIFMSPMSFIQKPVRWLQAISRFQATISGGPNFAYDLVCNHIREEQRQALDLSTWELAFSGAEPIQLKTLRRFSQMFGSCGFRQEAFYACYGMAEAVLLITGGNKAQPPVVQYVNDVALRDNRVVTATAETKGFQAMIGCGQTWLDGKIAIVDPHTLIGCPENQVGEIWVSGSGLAIGYWNDVEKTTTTFQAYIKDTGEGPFLRTGDLGFLDQGELFLTGRLNDVMVFWGLNHYPQLLEKTLQSCHPAFTPNRTAAFSVEVDGESQLVIAQEIERSYRHDLNVNAMVEMIRWKLFEEHFVDVYSLVFLKPGGIPKTSSGKIQRHACKTQFLEERLAAIAIWQRPLDQPMDMTFLLKRYVNPLTHLKRYKMIMGLKLQRILGLSNQ